MKTLIAILSFAVLSVSGCRKENNLFFSDQIFNLKLKEVKYSADGVSSIKLDSVLNESRCPKGVVCVWEGNAAARFIYEKENITRDFILNTHPNFRTDTLIDGFRIKLVSLNPYPIYGQEIKQSDYSAELSVSKQ